MHRRVSGLQCVPKRDHASLTSVFGEHPIDSLLNRFWNGLRWPNR